MEGTKDQFHEAKMVLKENHSENDSNWEDYQESIESSFGDSTNSIGSCSSLDMEEDDDDDASSSSLSSSSSASSSSYGPLYELSELMAQLPIKRGLSKYFEGKSQSYGCLGNVTSLEDLAKKGYFSYNKRMKTCKSYGGGFDGKRRSLFAPKTSITKKSSRRPILSSLGHKTTLQATCRSPFSLDKNL